ncbi:hypothetical protein BDV11DRAFT_215284 [Aspergillus similis]
MAARPRRPQHRRDFQVAIICALQLEADAVEVLFDHFWDDDGFRYGKAPGDPNAYRTGTIGDHNVVLVYMPGMGKGHASSVSASFRSSFDGIKLAMIVGICGAVPAATENGVFLGDVIIGNEIVVYDHGRIYPTGLEMRPDSVRKPNSEVQAFPHKVGSRKSGEQLIRRARHHFALLQTRDQHYFRPIKDCLFEPGYHHKHRKPPRCEKCAKDEACKKAQEATCEALGCDPGKMVARSRSFSSNSKSPSDMTFEDFHVHFVRIASGDSVMKSGEERDRIAALKHVLAFEMEGACDYADSHKDKAWQRFAAGTAAACMKALLEQHLNLALVFPKIDASFQSALACFKQYRKHLPRDVNLKSTLRAQRVIFSSNVQIILTDAICVEVSLAVQTKLQEMMSMASSLSTRKTPAVQTTAASQSLKNAVEDLKSLIDVFASLVSPRREARQLDAPPVQKKLEASPGFRHFRIVQEAASSLHNSLGVACNSHKVHDIDLSLQPTFSGKSTQVRFDVVIHGQGKAKRNLPRRAIWINVESIFESSQKSINDRPQSSFADASTLKKHRQVSINSATRPPKAPKRVKFESSLPDPPLSYFAAESSSSVPNLYLQRNLCAVVERLLKQHSLKSGNCIGLLGDAQACRHLLYIENRTASSRVSLSEVISLASGSKYLAAAVLYYHATPWLKRRWRSSDILFFGKSHELLEQAHDAIPYMSTLIGTLGPSNNSTSTSSDYDYIIRNPVLFGLGVMFLELAYQAPLRDLQKPVDLVRGQTPGFADYFTAHRLAEVSNSKVSRTFKDIIKKCLHCDFGHDSDFKSPALQEAFYHDVIIALEKLESVFRELQLGNSEPAS